MKNSLVQIIAFILASVTGFPVLAHHSTAEYDNNTITEAEGTVVDVSWFNPHVRLTISTEAFDGETMLWELEGMGVMRLDRAGIPRDLVSVGTTVRFAGTGRMSSSASVEDQSSTRLLSLQISQRVSFAFGFLPATRHLSGRKIRH